MELVERSIPVPAAPRHRDLIRHIESATALKLRAGEVPLRLAIAAIDDHKYLCEIGCLVGAKGEAAESTSIFAFRQRHVASAGDFNTVFIVPTGIGAEVGGHAGDATPAAQLLASCCDQLITHPNVVNASDINELPANALYVEGS